MKRIASLLATVITALTIAAQASLTDADYRKVANELGIEVAAIKALASIEGGGHGFAANGKPTINFDLSVYKKLLRQAGKSQAQARKASPIAFAGVNRARYGGYVEAQHARLDDACKFDRELALKATFWGMFQIGGFNYHLCGCKSVEEFVRLNSESELQQLELFGRFIQRIGLVKYVKAHNWRAFAQAYNGGRYVSGYASKLQRAYNRYK